MKNDAQPKYAEGLKFSTVDDEPVVIPMVPWPRQILSFLLLL